MLRSLGYAISFAYGNILCTNVQIYIMIGLLGLGFILFEVASYKRETWKGFEKEDDKEEEEKDQKVDLIEPLLKE